jgi:hypothetical protein
MSKASERVNEAVKAGEDKTEIERLAKLDEVAYMRARKEAAQKLGIDVGDLNKLVNDRRKAFVTASNGAGKAAAEEKTKQADVLIELAQAAKLFHTPDGVAYADVEVNDHRETLPVRRKGFKQWLGRQYYLAKKGAPNSEAMQSALNVIEAKPQFEGPQYEVYTRIAGLDGKIYLDLGDAEWRVIEIDTTGWRVIERAPVRFHRANGMRPLPLPERGGSITDLKKFLNVKSDEDFILAVSFQLAALRPTGPYPLLNLMGPPGAAKTTGAKVIRAPIDPNAASMRTLPREERDLFISARNSHVQGIDNARRLPDWLSDALCRLATGGGYGTRKLYEDDDEVIINVIKPVIITGIVGVVSAPDLMDRTIPLQLKAIPEKDRKREQKFWAEFNAALPRILGVLLNGVVTGLRGLPDVKLAGYPRMADFAEWATACETAYWLEGAFMSAYRKNMVGATEEIVDDDVVATALREWISQRPGDHWKGTAGALLEHLSDHVNGQVSKSKRWPADATRLSGRLRTFEPALRQLGIEMTFDAREKKAGTRMIEIRWQPDSARKTASAASAASDYNDISDLENQSSVSPSVSSGADAADTPADARLTLTATKLSH